MTLAAGQSLTHFEILGPLGFGGMGEVYRARDTRLDREAWTLASLNHANLAQPRSEAYLTRFPSGTGEWQVSTDGASSVAFSPDDSAIHYVDGHRRLYRVGLETGPEVVLGTPELLGQAEEGTQPTALCEGSSGRFLATQTLGASERRLVVVLDWAAELAEC